jgi:thiol-disulfide isomerase/thioredoxin
MEKGIAVKVVATLIVTTALIGLLASSNVYQEVKSSIVSTLCLSCIKLDPKTILNFTFKTANGEAHPDFVLENLTIGPVFLHYRQDVCPACDAIEPIIQEIFNASYEKEEAFEKVVEFNGTNVVFIHINLDHTSTKKRNSFEIYDKKHVGGVPMITIVTLNLDRVTVRPYYATGYGFLGKSKAVDAKPVILKLIEDAIRIYNQNKAGYNI